MGAALAWFTTVVLVYLGVLMLVHLGVDTGGILGNLLTGAEHSLSRPVGFP
ncbi:MAG TPA: hypothetical protein VGX00_00200 [Thermoplasmata archaeon]|nr:hypothetical protein [Thermoplasmata archaeon]